MEEVSKLCCLIIEDIYGTFFAEIYRHLIQKGRLSANHLAQRCRLPLRQAKSALAALIQLRLVYHHTSSDGLTTYQANTDNAYNLLRAGKLVGLVRREHGALSGQIIELLISRGHATARDLEQSILSNPGQSSEPPTVNGYTENGDSSESDDTVRFRNTLRSLMDAKYITAIREIHFHSPFDARQDIEKHFRETGKDPSTKGKKTRAELDGKIDAELESRLNAYASGSAIVRELETFDPIMTALTVNYSNLIISIRNRSVAMATEDIFGRRLGHVAWTACSQIGLDGQHAQHPSRDDFAEPAQILDLDQLHTDLSTTSVQMSHSHGWSVERQLVNGHGPPPINGSSNIPAIERQLEVLAESPLKFLVRGNSGQGWVLHRGKLKEFLRGEELMRLMSQTMSGPTLRIIRMLSDKGKLDEKTLQEVGLLGAKELRQCLAQLHVRGFLELQEVPREPQRQPNRTIFLWFYDAERVRKVFLNRLYETISRLLQRMHLERERVSATLSKVERTDVRGSEEEILSAAEYEVLMRWRQKETWFMAEIDRLDDSIAILRDL